MSVQSAVTCWKCLGAMTTNHFYCCESLKYSVMLRCIIYDGSSSCGAFLLFLFKGFQIFLFPLGFLRYCKKIPPENIFVPLLIGHFQKNDAFQDVITCRALVPFVTARLTYFCNTLSEIWSVHQKHLLGVHSEERLFLDPGKD